MSANPTEHEAVVASLMAAAEKDPHGVLVAMTEVLAKVERERNEAWRLGDEMAARIEERWSGPGGCDCRVCAAAKAWREIR